jgi:hypothetical protein
VDVAGGGGAKDCCHFRPLHGVGTVQREVHSMDHDSLPGDHSSSDGSNSAHAATPAGAALVTPSDLAGCDGESEGLQLLGLRDTKLQAHFPVAAAAAGGGECIAGAGPEDDRRRMQGLRGAEVAPVDDRGSGARDGERTFPRERKPPRNSRMWPRYSSHKPSDAVDDCSCRHRRVSLDQTTDGCLRSSVVYRSPCQGCTMERGTHHGKAGVEGRSVDHRSHG